MIKAAARIAALALALAGCASAPRQEAGVSALVEIDSIRSASYQEGPGPCILLPAASDGLPDAWPDVEVAARAAAALQARAGLQYAECAAVVSAALVDRGYSPVAEPTGARIAVFVDYGVDEPREETLYMTFAGSRVIGAHAGPGVGFPVRVTTYHRHATLAAYDLEAYLSGGVMRPLWRTEAASRGPSSDLRRVFPVLIAASAPHIGGDTGRRLTVEIREDDPAVVALRQKAAR